MEGGGREERGEEGKRRRMMERGKREEEEEGCIERKILTPQYTDDSPLPCTGSFAT